MFNVTIVWLPRKASVALEERSSEAGITHTAKAGRALVRWRCVQQRNQKGSAKAKMIGKIKRSININCQ
jgi:hypothetical protein